MDGNDLVNGYLLFECSIGKHEAASYGIEPKRSVSSVLQSDFIRKRKYFHFGCDKNLLYNKRKIS